MVFRSNLCFSHQGAVSQSGYIFKIQTNGLSSEYSMQNIVLYYGYIFKQPSILPPTLFFFPGQLVAFLWALINCRFLKKWVFHFILLDLFWLAIGLLLLKFMLLNIKRHYYIMSSLQGSTGNFLHVKLVYYRWPSISATIVRQSCPLRKNMPTSSQKKALFKPLMFNMKDFNEIL